MEAATSEAAMIDDGEQRSSGAVEQSSAQMSTSRAVEHSRAQPNTAEQLSQQSRTQRERQN